MKNIKSLVLIACLCVFASGADAFVFWDGVGGMDQNGSADSFDWMNGGSDNGYFGNPMLAGDTFIFTPEAFRAESVDGVSDSIGDRLEVLLMAHMGEHITGIKITEYGDYGVLGAGGEVQVSGGLFMTNTDVFDVATASLVSTPGSPITSGEGIWTATAEITGLDWKNVIFVLDNNLQAISIEGSTSYIQKKVVGTAIAIEFIPEPATLAILGFGALLLRRKK